MRDITFPIGWYVDMTANSPLQEIIDSPFNCVLLSVKDETRLQVDLFLNSCEKAGLWCILGLAGYVPGDPQMIDRVRQHYRHPAILAWNLHDEQKPSKLPIVQADYDAEKRIDPVHPVYGTFYGHNEIAPMVNTFDIVGTHIYPVPSEPINVVGTCVKKTLVVRKPQWAIIQACPYPERTNARTPFMAEMRSMTYDALSCGAQGILYWCYYRLRPLPEYARLWPQLCKLADEFCVDKGQM